MYGIKYVLLGTAIVATLLYISILKVSIASAELEAKVQSNLLKMASAEIEAANESIAAVAMVNANLKATVERTLALAAKQQQQVVTLESKRKFLAEAHVARASRLDSSVSRVTAIAHRKPALLAAAINRSNEQLFARIKEQTTYGDLR